MSEHNNPMMPLEQAAQEKSATEWLYNLDDSYLLHIQPCDSGYDYTIYSAHSGQPLDGGQMNMAIPTMTEVVQEIIKAHDLPTFPPEFAPPDLLDAIHEEKLPEAVEQQFRAYRTDAYAIYQLRDTEENAALRFMSYDYAQKKNLSIDHSRYELVYTADLLQDASKTLNDHLNDLYYRFNQDRPDDFQRHSLSVSDVVAIRHQGELTCVYVDSFGFKPLPDFYATEKAVEKERLSVHDQLRKPPVHAGKPKKSVQSHAEMEL